MVDSFPNNWDKALPFVLWSYRECPAEGLTFSPFELFFDRQPPSPLALLKNSWMSKLLVKPQMKHVFNYIHGMKNKMQGSLDITKKETKIVRNKSKQLYDRNSVERMLHVGQLVLMYLPVNGKPLATKLHDPYKVLEHKDTVNYLIETPDRRSKSTWCHVNMLRPYCTRDGRFNADTVPTILSCHIKLSEI